MGCRDARVHLTVDDRVRVRSREGLADERSKGGAKKRRRLILDAAEGTGDGDEDGAGEEDGKEKGGKRTTAAGAPRRRG